MDATYYEIGRYLKLLRKSNTQVLEILFSPESAFTYKHPVFDVIQENRYRLIDTNILKNSLKGYVHSEIRLATGSRSGQLGGKRKEAVEKFGFSPKNFCQILRLCKVGQVFFTNGEYMVNVKDHDPDYHSFLMDIKNTPEKFTCEQLEKWVDMEFNSLCTIMDNSKIKYTFDADLAAELILQTRNNEYYR